MKPLCLLCLATLLAACTLSGSPAASSASPLAWIDKPLDGSVFPMGQIEITSHAADPGGLAQVELRVNDQIHSVQASPDADLSLITLHQQWKPPAPGIYKLQIRAQNNAGVWSEFATVTVIIGADRETTAAAVPTVTPTRRPRPTAAPTSTPLPGITDSPPPADGEPPTEAPPQRVTDTPEPATPTLSVRELPTATSGR